MTKVLSLMILAVAALCVAPPLEAGPLLITLDTSSLSGPQTLLFGLTNFDSADNAVTLSDFDFGGGGALAGTQDCTFGGSFSGTGCSGDLGGSVLLEDLDPATFFTQQFNPGASLSFVLAASNNFAGPIPDQFAMSICDRFFTTCYSNDASGALLLLDFTGASLSSRFSLFGATDQGLSAPSVTTPVPEPGTLLLIASGMGCMLARRRLTSGAVKG